MAASLLENKKVYYGLLVIILICGVFYILSQSSNPFRFTDEKTYYDLTKNLEWNNVYALDNLAPTAIKPPGFSFALYIFFKISANINFIKVINFLFYILCIFTGGLIVKRYSYNTSPVLYAILICLYPVLFYTASTLYPQTLAALLFLLILYLSFNTTESFQKSLLIGAIWGLLILTVPTFFAIFILYVVFLRLSLVKKYVVWTFLTCFIILSSWCVRNYYVFDKPFMISSNFGINLFYGNSEYSHQDPNIIPDIDIIENGKFAKIENEVKRDDELKYEAMEYIKNNPLESVKFYFIKLLNYFNYTNELKTASQQNVFYDIVMFITYYFILLLVIIRIFDRKRFPLTDLEIFILGCYIISAVVSAIFFTRVRFRLPFDYLLILINAIYVSNLIQYKKAKSNSLTP